MKTSDFMKLGKSDIWKSALMFGFSISIAMLGKLLIAGGEVTINDLKVLAITGFSSAAGYLIKNLLTNSKDEFGKLEEEAQLPKN